MMALGILAAIGLSACARNDVLYLYVAKSWPHIETAASTVRVVQLRPFVEDFARNEIVGEQILSGRGRLVLKTAKSSVSQALDDAIRHKFQLAGMEPISGPAWDRTVEGLSQLAPAANMIMDGRITNFWIDAQTGLTHTKLKTAMELEWTVGLPSGKIVHQSLQVNKEIVKLSSAAHMLDEAAGELIAEAAEEAIRKLTGADLFKEL